MPQEVEEGEKTELRRVTYMLRLSLEELRQLEKDEPIEKMVWKETDSYGNAYEVNVKVHRGP